MQQSINSGLGGKLVELEMLSRASDALSRT